LLITVAKSGKENKMTRKPNTIDAHDFFQPLKPSTG